ncbi:MAG: TPM domain-containing protein [Deltaproteobacteria bacterium]
MSRRSLLACACFALAFAVLGLWRHKPDAAKEPDSAKAGPRRVYDEAGVIPAGDVSRFENYLKWIFEESDVDVRLVLRKDLSGVPPEKAAIDWMERLKIGGQGREERGVLVLYDLEGQCLRVELGYGLEEYLPDGFIGYLMNDHARMFFASGDVSTGLRLMIRILQHRIRLAVLGERFDPTVLNAVSRTGRLSGGGGASAAMEFRRGSAGYYRSEVGPEGRARYTAQDSPEQTYLRYLEWMAGERFDPSVEMFTPETREYLKGFPMSRAYFDYILLGEYGKRFRADIRGDLALLYFTNDPFVSPHFFRRRDNRWYMDLCAEVRNTVERVGGVYTWDYRGRDDDFTKAFSDKLVNIQGYIRIVGGDNRRLPIRRSSSKASDASGRTKMQFAAAEGRT